MLEQHGPHLPVGSDTLGVVYEANGVSRRVSQALPDWNIVMMPAINYGQAGANLIGDMLVHPGTYGIRQSTLRSLVADVGGQLAQNGFKWIFVLNGHSSPTHSIAINQACDFISETFRVTMLHLSGLFKGDTAIQARGEEIKTRHFSAPQILSHGMDVHAGVSETSQTLATRPDLVRSDYKTLPDRAGRTLEELRSIATAPGWQGYLSSPSKATATYGRAVKEWWIDSFDSSFGGPSAGKTCSINRGRRIQYRRPRLRFSTRHSTPRGNSEKSSISGWIKAGRTKTAVNGPVG